MSALAKLPVPASEAVILLRPANQHELELLLSGRIGRTFTREQVAELAEAVMRVPPALGKALIAAFLPGFTGQEYAAFVRAVREFERLVAIEGERDNPRHWSNAVRVSL